MPDSRASILQYLAYARQAQYKGCKCKNCSRFHDFYNDGKNIFFRSVYGVCHVVIEYYIVKKNSPAENCGAFYPKGAQ